MLLKKRAKQSKKSFFHTPSKIPEHALSNFDDGNAANVLNPKMSNVQQGTPNVQVGGTLGNTIE